MAQDAPVFLVGCGRSGTTILYEVLAEHPDFAWISNLTNRTLRYSLARLSRQKLAARPHKGTKGVFRHVPHPVEGYAVWDHCTSTVPTSPQLPWSRTDVTSASRAAIIEMVDAHLRHQDGSRFLNKNTRNTRRIPFLREVFPQAYFVHVVRHPLPVARSLSKVSFWDELPLWWSEGRDVVQKPGTAEADLLLAAEFWARETSLVLDHQEAGDERLIQVKYEDLLEDPDSIVRNVLAGLGMEWDDRMQSVLSRVEARPNSPDALSAELRERFNAVVAEPAERLAYHLPRG